MFVMHELCSDTVDQCAETVGRYHVLMLVSIQSKVFYDVIPCSLLDDYQHFIGVSCFHLLGPFLPTEMQ